MHTAKTQSVRQPQRNRFLLRPKPYYRHYGPAAWIDPVILRAITISWNNIRIPVRPFHGHPDNEPHPWFTNDFSLPCVGCGGRGPKVTQHQCRSESERYGHYPHASPSLQSFLICSCGMPRITKNQENQRRQCPYKACYPNPNPKRPSALLGHLSGKRYRSNRDNENKPPHSVVSGRPP